MPCAGFGPPKMFSRAARFYPRVISLSNPSFIRMSSRKITKSEDEWRSMLTPEQFRVTRKSGTEAPFTGAYWKHDVQGRYLCVCCDAVLFESDEKFFSSCGWPAFERNKAGNIEESRDESFGMVRTEVKCNNCGSHLGHLFDDGPTKTGMRYCINSASLKFESSDKK